MSIVLNKKTAPRIKKRNADSESYMIKHTQSETFLKFQPHFATFFLMVTNEISAKMTSIQNIN